VALLEQDVFVTKLLVTFFHNTSFGKVLQMNISCSAMYEYISCKHCPPSITWWSASVMCQL